MCEGMNFIKMHASKYFLFMKTVSEENPSHYRIKKNFATTFLYKIF